VSFNPLPDLPGIDDVYYVDFSAAQRNTRKLFGKDKPWFTETGFDPPVKKKDRSTICLRFIQASREAWTGLTDCIVWWSGGYDRDFIAVMKTLSEKQHE